MDQVSKSVKSMYEQYPYPPGEPAAKICSNVSLLLAEIRKVKKTVNDQINVLDAGCGRGVALIGAASKQPHVNFVGADMNTAGLANAANEVKLRGLTNVTLVEADLMTLEGIEVPEGGFDIIYSSGVVHHMSDPYKGLKNLEGILAPHGVIAFMVYGTHGRQDLYRVIEAIDIVSPMAHTIDDRLPLAKSVAKEADSYLFRGRHMEGTHAAHKTEFVDKCLNVNETSYTIDSLWELFGSCGLKFIKWMHQDEWNIDELVDDEDLKRKLNLLTKKEQYKYVDLMFERPMLAMLLTKSDVKLKEPVLPQYFEKAMLAFNPEMGLSTSTNFATDGSGNINELSYTVQGGTKKQITDIMVGRVVLLLKGQNKVFSGAEYLALLARVGIDRVSGMRIANTLIDLCVLYSPHKATIR
jgi:SAM-dependent methyltransferase